jgi:hypothetical protein
MWPSTRLLSRKQKALALEFSRNQEPIWYKYIIVRLLAHVIRESKKLHNISSYKLDPQKSQEYGSKIWKPESWRTNGEDFNHQISSWDLVLRSVRPQFCKTWGPKAGENQYPRSSSQTETEFNLPLHFLLFRPSMNWMDGTTLGRIIYFTQSANTNANLFQKHPHKGGPQIMLIQLSDIF